MSLKHLAGKLIEVEGVDGVGKTTLANMLVKYICDHSGQLGGSPPARYMSFPGRVPGSLGEVVYDIHHRDPKSFTGGISEIALQALHVATHVNVIEPEVIPALKAGISVVLDRSLMSTKIYGENGGAPDNQLDALIRFEREVWGEYRPHIIFLITSDKPYRQVNITDECWQDIARRYRVLAEEEKARGVNVQTIANFDRTAEETLQHMLLHLEE